MRSSTDSATSKLDGGMTDDIKAMLGHAEEAADLLKAMANKNRLLILCNLLAGELSVGELQKHLNLGQSALSQHLALLRKDNLVSARRESQSVYYSLAGNEVRRMIQLLHDIYCTEPTISTPGPPKSC